VAALRIAAGQASLEECSAADADGDRQITESDLDAAISTIFDPCDATGESTSRAHHLPQR